MKTIFKTDRAATDSMYLVFKAFKENFQYAKYYEDGFKSFIQTANNKFEIFANFEKPINPDYKIKVKGCNEIRYTCFYAKSL